MKVLSEVSGVGKNGAVGNLYLIGEEDGKKLSELGGNDGGKVFKANGGNNNLNAVLGICVGEEKKEKDCEKKEGYKLRLVGDEGWIEELSEDNLKTNFSGFLVGKTTGEENSTKTANEKVDLSKIGNANVQDLFDGVKWNPNFVQVLKKDSEFVELLETIKKGFDGDNNCPRAEGKNLLDWLGSIAAQEHGRTCNVSLYDVLNKNENELKEFFKGKDKEKSLKLLLSLMSLWSLTADNSQNSLTKNTFDKIGNFNKALKVNGNKITSNFVGLSSSSEDKADGLKVWAGVTISSITLKGGRDKEREVNLTFNSGNVNVKIGELEVKFSMDDVKKLDKDSLKKYLGTKGTTSINVPLFGIFSNGDNNKNLFNLICLLALLVSDGSNREVDVSFDVKLNNKDLVATIKKAS